MYTYCLAEVHSIDDVLQPVKSSTRIKYACISVVGDQIALGTNSGLVHTFKRHSLQYIQVIKIEEEDRQVVTHVALSPTDSGLIAIAFSSGNVVVSMQGGYGRASRYSTIRHMTLLAGLKVTCMEWAPDGSRVLVGACNGWVCAANIVNVKRELLPVPVEVLLRLDSAVTQLCCARHSFLVSTHTRTFVCNTEKKQFRQIGKKLRESLQGACLLNVPGLPTLAYCARPGGRLWEADAERAHVINTHQLRELLLAVPPGPVLSRLRKNETPSSSPGPKSASFTTLHLMCGRWLVTLTETGLFVLDPVTVSVLFWTQEVTLNTVADLCIAGPDLYVLERSGRPRRLTLLTMDSLVAELNRLAACIQVETGTVSSIQRERSTTSEGEDERITEKEKHNESGQESDSLNNENLKTPPSSDTEASSVESNTSDDNVYIDDEKTRDYTGDCLQFIKKNIQSLSGPVQTPEATNAPSSVVPRQTSPFSSASTVDITDFSALIDRIRGSIPEFKQSTVSTPSVQQKSAETGQSVASGPLRVVETEAAAPSQDSRAPFHPSPSLSPSNPYPSSPSPSPRSIIPRSALQSSVHSDGSAESGAASLRMRTRAQETLSRAHTSLAGLGGKLLRGISTKVVTRSTGGRAGTGIEGPAVAGPNLGKAGAGIEIPVAAGINGENVGIGMDGASNTARPVFKAGPVVGDIARDNSSSQSDVSVESRDPLPIEDGEELCTEAAEVSLSRPATTQTYISLVPSSATTAVTKRKKAKVISFDEKASVSSKGPRRSSGSYAKRPSQGSDKPESVPSNSHSLASSETPATNVTENTTESVETENTGSRGAYTGICANETVCDDAVSEPGGKMATKVSPEATETCLEIDQKANMSRSIVDTPKDTIKLSNTSENEIKSLQIDSTDNKVSSGHAVDADCAIEPKEDPEVTQACDSAQDALELDLNIPARDSALHAASLSPRVADDLVSLSPRLPDESLKAVNTFPGALSEGLGQNEPTQAYSYDDIQALMVINTNSEQSIDSKPLSNSAKCLNINKAKLETGSKEATFGDGGTDAMRNSRHGSTKFSLKLSLMSHNVKQKLHQRALSLAQKVKDTRDLLTNKEEFLCEPLDVGPGRAGQQQVAAEVLEAEECEEAMCPAEPCVSLEPLLQLSQRVGDQLRRYNEATTHPDTGASNESVLLSSLQHWARVMNAYSLRALLQEKHEKQASQHVTSRGDEAVNQASKEEAPPPSIGSLAVSQTNDDEAPLQSLGVAAINHTCDDEDSSPLSDEIERNNLSKPDQHPSSDAEHHTTDECTDPPAGTVCPVQPPLDRVPPSRAPASLGSHLQTPVERRLLPLTPDQLCLVHQLLAECIVRNFHGDISALIQLEDAVFRDEQLFEKLLTAKWGSQQCSGFQKIAVLNISQTCDYEQSGWLHSFERFLYLHCHVLSLSGLRAHVMSEIPRDLRFQVWCIVLNVMQEQLRRKHGGFLKKMQSSGVHSVTSHFAGKDNELLSAMLYRAFQQDWHAAMEIGVTILADDSERSASHDVTNDATPANTVAPSPLTALDIWYICRLIKDKPARVSSSSSGKNIEESSQTILQTPSVEQTQNASHDQAKFGPKPAKVYKITYEKSIISDSQEQGMGSTHIYNVDENTCGKRNITEDPEREIGSQHRTDADESTQENPEISENPDRDMASRQGKEADENPACYSEERDSSENQALSPVMAESGTNTGEGTDAERLWLHFLSRCLRHDLLKSRLVTLLGEVEVYGATLSAVFKLTRPSQPPNCSCQLLPRPGAHMVPWAGDSAQRALLQQLLALQLFPPLTRDLCQQYGHWAAWLAVAPQAGVEREALAEVILQLDDPTLLSPSGFFPENKEEWQHILRLMCARHPPRDVTSRDHVVPSSDAASAQQTSVTGSSKDGQAKATSWCLKCGQALSNQNQAGGITWECLAAMLLRAQGAATALRMLRPCCTSGDNKMAAACELPFSFFRSCVSSALDTQRHRSLCRY